MTQEYKQNMEYFLGSAVNLEDIRLCLKRKLNKTKREAPLLAPATSNIKWKSDKIRRIWEPRIIRIAEVREEIEILSVSYGLRDCCYMDDMYNYEILSLADRHPELNFFLDKNSGFTRNLHHDVYILRKDSKLPSQNIRLMDVSLGYPNCCFESHWNNIDKPILLKPWEVALNTKQSKVNDNVINTRCAPETNFLLVCVGLAAVPHIPCSFDCKETISNCIGFMNVGRKRFPEEMDWLKEILSWPVESSFVDGIETVKTPFFRWSFKFLEDYDMWRKEPGYKKYVLRLNDWRVGSAPIEQAI